MARKKGSFLSHIKSIGFSNRLSIYCLLFITFTLIAGFILAIMSLRANYLGSLICFTATLTPVSTAASITLTACVQKSKAENTEGGVKYQVAMASLSQQYNEPSNEDIPEDFMIMPDDEDLSGDTTI